MHTWGPAPTFPEFAHHLPITGSIPCSFRPQPIRMVCRYDVGLGVGFVAQRDRPQTRNKLAATLELGLPGALGPVALSSADRRLDGESRVLRPER